MRVEVINGLLGSGKTTFLQRRLTEKDPAERVAVLVNEFGAVGIDGDLLQGQGADVVELPNGCICCTLTADLRRQIQQIAERYQPQRLLIEPTGVATVKNLLRILQSLSLEKYIASIHITVVLDGSMFDELWGQNQSFLRGQLEPAQTVVVNKADKLTQQQVTNIIRTIRSINPASPILLTTFGKVVKQELQASQSPNPLPIFDAHQQTHIHETAFKSWEEFSDSSTENFDLEKLRAWFTALKDNQFGLVDRAKGLFLTPGNRWVRFDLAAREVAEVELKQVYATSKVLVIGTNLSTQKLTEAFKNCRL